MVPGTPLGHLDRFEKHTKAKNPSPNKFRTVCNTGTILRANNPCNTSNICCLEYSDFSPPKFVFLSSCCVWLWANSLASLSPSPHLTFTFLSSTRAVPAKVGAPRWFLGFRCCCPAPSGGVSTRHGSRGSGPACGTGLWCHLVFVTAVGPQRLPDGKGSIQVWRNSQLLKWVWEVKVKYPHSISQPFCCTAFLLSYRALIFPKLSTNLVLIDGMWRFLYYWYYWIIDSKLLATTKLCTKMEIGSWNPSVCTCWALQ